MTMIFGIPIQAFLGQLLVGLINGSFYALLSLGLAVIFGLLRVINFAHGAQYMLGAFVALLGLKWLGIPYWAALVVAPLVVGGFGALLERTMLSRLYSLDPLYGLLFTFGLALALEGTMRYYFGASGQPYSAPPALTGAVNLGFMVLPIYASLERADPRVIEAGNKFEGRRFRKRLLLDPRRWWWLRDPTKPTWGEHYRAIGKRMMAAIEDARDHARGREVLVVSHQLPIWTIRSVLEQRPLWHDPRRRECNLASLTSVTFVGDEIVDVTYSEPAAHLYAHAAKTPGA